MIKSSEKVAYGLGDMSSSMFWKLMGMYMLYFYTDVFGLAPATVGTMFLITRIWDSVTDPVIGLIADRTHTRWGKFRPYILFGAVPFAVFGILTFVVPDFSYAGKLVYAYITYTLMMMVYSIVNVPYASLLGVMSSDPKDRNTLSSYRMFFAYLGSFVVLALAEPLVGAFSGAGENSSEAHGWLYMVVLIGSVCALLFFICFRGTRERVKPMPSGQSSVWTDIKDLARNYPWWILLGAGIAALIFNSIRDGAAIYYFKYYIAPEGHGDDIFGGFFPLSSLYLVLGQASNMVGVALAAPVANRIGKKKTYMAAMGLAALLSMAFYSLGPDHITLIFILQGLISISAGCVFPLLWSMYADISDYSELKTGKRATGLIFSSSSMSQKIGWTLGGAITGWLLGYYGLQSNAVQSSEMLSGIRMIVSYFPAVGALLSLVFISFYPLSEKRVRKIVLELGLKREGRQS